MTLTEGGTEQAAKKPRPAAFLRAFLFGGLWGVALAGIVVGPVIGNLWVLFAGIGLFLVAFVIFGTVEARKQEANKQDGDEPEREPGLALARIESRRALGGESGDIPVEFVLTVAPDDRPAYRVRTNQTINLVDIHNYPSDGLVVVEYHHRLPWQVRIVTEPTPEWARRLTEDAVDSAPESALVTGPRPDPASCLLGIAGLLTGAALVVVLFHGDLFDSGSSSTAVTSGAPVTRSSSSSESSSSTVVVTNGSTVFSSSYTLAEPGEPMLRAGRMSAAADALSARTGSSEVTRLTITQRTMTVRGSLADSTAGAGQDPQIDLRAVPYGQLPALVSDAKSTLGVADPTSWAITFGHDAAGKALVIHVSVRDGQGNSASLTADAQGHVTKRSPRAGS